MNTSRNKLHLKEAVDPIDRLIFEQGLKIKSVWIDKDLDLMVVLLNNRKIIQRALSVFRTLSQASLPDVLNFENDGFGIHWDEDLSLRGFLKTDYWE
jgi:hypothetical protein